MSKSWVVSQIAVPYPKDKEPEQRRIVYPERHPPEKTKRMESHELGYQVVREPLAACPTAKRKDTEKG